MFIHDYVRQCKKWIKNNKEVFMMGDINDNAIMGELSVKLAAEGIELSKVSSPYWSGVHPASHVNGRDFIVLVAKSKGLEVTQLLILPHFCSVGDHRSWVVELTTCSVLGPCRLRIQRTPGRRLVTKNYKALTRYNSIARSKFDEHNIVV